MNNFKHVLPFLAVWYYKTCSNNPAELCLRSGSGFQSGALKQHGWHGTCRLETSDSSRTPEVSGLLSGQMSQVHMTRLDFGNDSPGA